MRGMQTQRLAGLEPEPKYRHLRGRILQEQGEARNVLSNSIRRVILLRFGAPQRGISRANECIAELFVHRTKIIFGIFG
jgi:hypothetical protein